VIAPTTKDIRKLKTIREIWNHPHKLGWILGYDKLSEIHSQWIRYLYLSKVDRTILAHRDSYKTTACTIVGTIWFLYFFPNNRILNASATPDKVSEIAGEIRTCYEKKDNLRELYSLIDVQDPIDKDWWIKDKQALSTRSGIFQGQFNIEYLSTRSEATGKHYTHINCDDIVTFRDMLSSAEREYKDKWWMNLQSVKSKDVGCHIARIGTIWHPLDLYSKDEEKFKTYPKYPALSIKINGFTKETLQQKEDEIGSKSFVAAQYHIKHISDEDRIFDNPNYIPASDFPKDIKLIAVVDPAFGGKDDVGMTIGGISDGKYFIKYGFTWNKSLTQYYGLIVKKYAMSKAIKLFIEDNAGQKSFLDMIRTMGLFPKGHTAKDNKYIRIHKYVQRNWNNIYFSDEVEDNYMQQIIFYQEPEDFSKRPKSNIGGLDSLAGLIEISGKKSYGPNPDYL